MNNVIELLFRDDEWVNVCIESPRESRNTLTVKEGKKVKKGKYFCINPLKPRLSRKQMNLSARRNFLIEFDKGSLDDQGAWITGLYRIPYRTVTFSGNKSLHCIVALDKNIDKCYYRDISRRLKDAIRLADAACFEPARLSRLSTEDQPLRAVGDIISVEQLEEWLTWLGVGKEIYEEKRQEDLAVYRDREGTLSMTTLRLIAGEVAPCDAHRASLGAAKNLQELGNSRADIIVILAKARQLTRTEETWDESVYKARRVVDWVFDNWKTDEWADL